MKNPSSRRRQPNPSNPRAIARLSDPPVSRPIESAQRATSAAVTTSKTVKRRAAAAHIAFLLVDGCFFGWLCRTGSTELGLRQRPLLEGVVTGGGVAVLADAAELRRLDVAV